MHGTHDRTRSYSPLTHEDREEIMIGLRMEKSIREIARHLNRHPSVISREIRANSTEDRRYQASWADNRCTRRRKRVIQSKERVQQLRRPLVQTGARRRNRGAR
jgi:transposase, IS30 family